MRYAVVLITWISLAPAAFAASFDCSKSLSEVEAIICGNPTLSQADDDLAAAYRQAHALSLVPQELQAGQRGWLSARELSTLTYGNKSVALLEAYKKRISELQDQANAWRPANRALTEEQARQKCVTLPDIPSSLECRVEAFGDVKGNKDGMLRYQHLTYWGLDDGEQYPQEDIVVFQRSTAETATLKPVAAASQEAGIFDEVEIIKSSAARWLLITGHSGEHGYRSLLYKYEAGRITGIDIDRWEHKLRLRQELRGFDLATWIRPDYAKMTADAVFTKDGRPPCCSTSTQYVTAYARLGLSGDRLVLKDVRFERSSATGRQ